MIPLRLSLKNFMCYRELPLLDLRGIHLACLCGNNGHGKSALLDAITWALWGKVRGMDRLSGGRSLEDELVHQGQSHMEVELELQVGEQVYRVLRKYSRGQPRGTRSAPVQRGTTLELNLRSNGSWRAITGNSVRETQAAIERLLRMGYDLFIHSAFLLQGQADRFTRAQPAQRRAILGEILGLSYYASLEEVAREKRKDFQAREGILRAQLEMLKGEVSKREQYEAELATALQHCQAAEGELAAQAAAVSGLQQARAALEAKGGELKRIEGDAKQARAALEDLRRQEQEVALRIQRHHGLLQDKERVLQGFSLLQQTQEQEERLSQKQAAFYQLAQSRGQFEAFIRDARRDMEVEQRQLQKEVSELHSRAAALPALQAELERVRTRLLELASQEQGLQERRLRAQELRAQIESLRARESQLGEKREEAAELLALLEKGDSSCPLCQRELTAQGRVQLIEKNRVQLESLDQALGGARQQMQQQERDWGLLQGDIQRREAQLRKDLSEGQRLQATVEKQLDDALRAQDGVKVAQERLRQAQQKLESGDFAHDQRRALAQTESQLAAIGYDAQEHQALRDRIRVLKPFDGQHRDLQVAEQVLPREREGLERIQEGIGRWARTLEEQEARRRTLQGELEALPALKEKLRVVQEEQGRLQERCRQAQARQAQAQQAVQRLESLSAQARQAEGELGAVRNELWLHRELEQAFGKGGIQAYIVESILPDLEAEANSLLARMTDNRMHLKIETVRETQKGKAEEVLDIKTSDELGTRSYELYSGGEAFRIDFALRIALSRLLARRAGAPLPTLFIDEGFGTQDSAGRERLIEAIRSIQDDFQLILVITHIDELKDAFPVRIEVTRTEEGSRVAMT